jgi:REP element-mobilizing transposase RayT
MIVQNEKTVYHVISRTALPGFPMGPAEKKFLLSLIKRFAKLYFTEIIGFCLMGNHFHLLVKMLPESNFTDADIQKRCEQFYGKAYLLPEGWLTHFRQKLASLSAFMGDIKVNFARYYNRLHTRRGYFRGDRFKSVIEKNRCLSLFIL